MMTLCVHVGHGTRSNDEPEAPHSVLDIDGFATDRFITRVNDLGGDVLAFSSGHMIRMIAARWLGLSAAAGRVFFCRPASVGVLGFEHERRDQPVIRLWNYVSEPRE